MAEEGPRGKLGQSCCSPAEAWRKCTGQFHCFQVWYVINSNCIIRLYVRTESDQRSHLVKYHNGWKYNLVQSYCISTSMYRFLSDSFYVLLPANEQSSSTTPLHVYHIAMSKHPPHFWQFSVSLLGHHVQCVNKWFILVVSKVVFVMFW